MKKLIIILLTFFLYWNTNAFTWDLVEIKNETFIELDYSIYDYDLQINEYSSWSLSLISPDYTKELWDISKLLFQIKILLLIIWFFSLLFVFYTLINDLLWKK